jgi:hypothetical protein
MCLRDFEACPSNAEKAYQKVESRKVARKEKARVFQRRKPQKAMLVLYITDAFCYYYVRSGNQIIKNLNGLLK